MGRRDKLSNEAIVLALTDKYKRQAGSKSVKVSIKDENPACGYTLLFAVLLSCQKTYKYFENNYKKACIVLVLVVSLYQQIKTITLKQNIMTTLTIITANSANGKHSVEVSDSTVLTGAGIEKAKYVGNLNIYMATPKAIERLKKQFTCNEVSKW